MSTVDEAALLEWASTPEGDAALTRAGWIRFSAAPLTIRVNGRLRVLEEMQGQDLLLWQRLQLEAGARLKHLPADSAEALVVINTVNAALVGAALGISPEEALQIHPSIRRKIVAVQDALNQTDIVAGVLRGE